MLPRIKSIIKVYPYTIICKWSTDEILAIDFIKFSTEIQGEYIHKLFSESTFNQVKLNTISKTLYLDKMLEGKDEIGNIIFSDLDFCPDILYKHSEIIPN